MAMLATTWGSFCWQHEGKFYAKVAKYKNVANLFRKYYQHAGVSF
jgi:hypothetical protein